MWARTVWADGDHGDTKDVKFGHGIDGEVGRPLFFPFVFNVVVHVLRKEVEV